MKLTSVISSLALVALLHSGVVGVAQTFTVTDLGAGTAKDINSSGHVVGTTADAQAFYYNGAISKNIVIPLGQDPNGGATIYSTNSAAIAINDSDQVLDSGFYGTPPFNYGSAVGIYSGVTGTQLGYLSLPVGLGMNNAGTTVGYSVDGSTNGLRLGLMLFLDGHTYYYGLVNDGFGTTVYYNFSMGYSSLHAINDSDVAAGAAATAIGSLPGGPFTAPTPLVNLVRATIFRTNSFEYIDTRDAGTNVVDAGLPENHLSDAYSINASGHVVGDMSLIAGSAVKHAFRYTGSGLEDLGTLGGASSSAYDINSTDQVVGTSTTASGEAHAFIWQGGVMTDLNTLLPSGSGWVLTRANAINNLGQIVGTGTFGGTAHAFLLSPASLTPGPGIAVEPEGKTLALGEAYTLSVTALGGAPLSYQWQHAGTNLPNATNSTFVIGGATAFDAGSYRVTVTNVTGNALSRVVEIIVQDPLLTGLSFFGLKVQGAVGASYSVEYQAPPVTTWIPLTTLTLTNTSQIYIDLESPDHPHRLYRAVRQP